ncbi:MAG: hypothetical protein ABDH61_02785 [Acidilobaceae archaeon]
MSLLGAAGGILKFLAGMALIYYVAIFAYAASELSSAKEEVSSATNVVAATEVLRRTLNDVYSFVNLNVYAIIIVCLLWIVGTSLLARSWDSVTEKWPRRAKIAYAAAAVLTGLMVFLASAYLARPFLLQILEGRREVEEVMRYFAELELSWALPYLFASPLLLPVLRGLLTFLYPAGGTWVGAAFLLLGGLTYSIGIFQVYRIFRPLQELREELSQAFSEQLTEFQVVKLLESSLASLEIMVNRTEGLVLVVSLASLFYGIGFLLLDKKLLARAVGKERAEKL